VQCAQCNEVSHHSCLAATGEELERKVLRPEERGEVQCRVCFCELANCMERVGHMLVHSPQELSQVGLHEQLLLRYVAEQFPRGDEAARVARGQQLAPEDLSNMKPLDELLVLNRVRNDGLTKVLLSGLSGVAREAIENALRSEDRLFHGLSDPSNWAIACEPSGKRLRLTLRFVEPARVGRINYSVALVGDGTFTPGLPDAERLNLELAVMLALVAGGEWKRQAGRGGRELEYVAWYRVRQQLIADGRAGLAELFGAFFAKRQYDDAALAELVSNLELDDWGFSGAVVTAEP
jgi:hypothetical protein